MRWFNEISEEGKILVYTLAILVFLPIVLFIADANANLQRSELEIEKAAIEAGLHQEVIDGEVVWTK